MGLLDSFCDSEIKNLELERLLNYEGSNGIGILFLNGFASSPKDVEFFLKLLATKKYSIKSPDISGCTSFDTREQMNGFMPEQLLSEAKAAFLELASRVEKVVLVGVSFGGNIAISLANEGHEKIKAVVTLETPIFFKNKIAFGLRWIQPVLKFLGIKHLRKSNFLYRKNYVDDGHSLPWIPLLAVGRIYRYIKDKTFNELRKVSAPFLIVQAKNSDLIASKSAQYISDNIQSKIKEIYYVPVDNHDLSLLDEEGRVVMVQKILNFIDSN